MNGRVYDPQIGRFVSADPIVSTTSFDIDDEPSGWLSKLKKKSG
jgi:hypothetical protein